MPKYIQLSDGLEEFDYLMQLQDDEEALSARGRRSGRGRERFRNFVQRAGQAVKKFGPAAAAVGLTAVTGGAGAPALVAKLPGAAKLIRKHGPNARGFLKGVFQARKGAAHQGPIPVAVPADAPAEDVAAAQEAADLLNNPNPAAFTGGGAGARIAQTGGIKTNQIVLYGAIAAGLYFISRKKRKK